MASILSNQMARLSLNDPNPFALILPDALPAIPKEITAIINEYLMEDITLLFIKTLLYDFITDRDAKREIDEAVAFWGKRVREIDLGATTIFIYLQGRREPAFFTRLVARTLQQHYPFVTEITHPYGGFTKISENGVVCKKSLQLRRLCNFTQNVRVVRPVYTPPNKSSEEEDELPLRYAVSVNTYPMAQARECGVSIAKYRGLEPCPAPLL